MVLVSLISSKYINQPANNPAFMFLFYVSIIQYELLKDHKALNTLRELLVIIRIWGLLRPSCLPVFLRSADNLDVLALLFRLLSKLVHPNGDTQAQQVDDGLIGEYFPCYTSFAAETGIVVLILKLTPT